MLKLSFAVVYCAVPSLFAYVNATTEGHGLLHCRNRDTRSLAVLFTKPNTASSPLTSIRSVFILRNLPQYRLYNQSIGGWQVARPLVRSSWLR